MPNATQLSDRWLSRRQRAILELLPVQGAAAGGMTVEDLAARLGLHRAAQHGLFDNSAAGQHQISASMQSSLRRALALLKRRGLVTQALTPDPYMARFGVERLRPRKPARWLRTAEGTAVVEAARIPEATGPAAPRPQHLITP